MDELNQNKRYTCPCCGFPGLDVLPYERASGVGLIRGVAPPYSKLFGKPTYDCCSCCGFEFGGDDGEQYPGVESESFESYLMDWIAVGCPWLFEEEKPENWSLRDQIFNASIQVK